MLINTNPRDRTTEFNSILQHMESKIRKQNPPKASSSKRSEFSAIAQEIGHAINITTDKLQRLTELAKRKTLFDDRPEEIQELTVSINEDIKRMNEQIGFLQQLNNDHRNKQTTHHSDTIVDTLKFQLKNATKRFSSILEMRTQNLKAQQEDQMIFMGSRNSSLSRRQSNSPLYSAVPTEEPPENQEVAITMPQQTMVLHDRHLQSRAEAVISIQRTITELQGIFQQLAHLVAEQGELIERIDTNVENTVANVEGAQAQLIKYLSGLKNNRMLIIKLFLVLIFFIIIFVVFFV